VKRPRWFRLSLVGRNIAEIAVWTVVVQLAIGLTFLYAVQGPRIAGMARYAVQHAEAMRLALAALDGAAADRYIAAINAVGPTEIVRGRAPVEAGERPAEFVLRLFTRGLAERIPAAYEARWQLAPQRRLWLGMDVNGEKIWIGLAAGVLLTNTSSALLGTLGLVGLVALGGAYAIQRRLNRPLRRLIDASEEMAAGRMPEPLPEKGAQEVARLARTFNGMVDSLARADRERALMLAGISHDLRTPLTKLRFALEYVGPHCEPEMRALMERNIEAADRIIDQFIDFARYGSDEAVQSVDLSALAQEVVRSFEPLAQPIALELAPLPALRLRRTAMYRLIANLVRNALDYAGRDMVVRTAAGSDAFVLSVLDRGPGIPTAEIERLKQPFTRLEAARSGPGGSGLGLAVVERVARLHDGRFELLARTGGGLEARLSLPLTVRAP
jgi:two-component system osmolarity sensor histidine kinase EnvZ